MLIIPSRPDLKAVVPQIMVAIESGDGLPENVIRTAKQVSSAAALLCSRPEPRESPLTEYVGDCILEKLLARCLRLSLK